MVKRERLDFNIALFQKLSETDRLFDIVALVIENSRWVDPRVYHEVEVVFPLTRRRSGASERRGQIVDGIKLWFNEPAGYALRTALGIYDRCAINSYVCHIYDSGVQSPDHFTRLSNMVLLPKALQSLSEWDPINEVLKYRAYELYRYIGPNTIAPERPVYYDRLKRFFDEGSLSENDFERVVKKLKRLREERPMYSTTPIPR